MRHSTCLIVIASFFCSIIGRECNAARTGGTITSSSVQGLIRRSIGTNEVSELPGYSGELPSRIFSGYVSLDKDGNKFSSANSVSGAAHPKREGKHFFYVLVESQRNPDEDPVILWLTGGPGCSGMDAFVYEHGPFTFTEPAPHKLELEKNPYSWTKVATVIYVDSPIGTGLSYSSDKDDYTTDDDKTTSDLYDFLQGFYDEYPELRKRVLYIAGESYGGVYVPLLAEKVVVRNRHAHKDRIVPLKGYLIGNAVTDDEIDGNSQVEFAYNLGLISPVLHHDLERECNGNYWNATQGSKCMKLLLKVDEGIRGINYYSILDPCFTGKNVAEAAAERRLLQAAIKEGSADKEAKQRAATLTHAVACADRRFAIEWVNSPDVRRALHAPPVDELQWTPCSDVLDYRFQPADMVPVHARLLNQGLRAMVYSGDHDYVVPFTGTRRWVYGMDLRSEVSYRPWFMDGQVAGFYERFEGGLLFITVKGAGHMVPQTRPPPALELFSRFLADQF